LGGKIRPAATISEHTKQEKQQLSAQGPAHRSKQEKYKKTPGGSFRWKHETNSDAPIGAGNENRAVGATVKQARSLWTNSSLRQENDAGATNEDSRAGSVQNRD
jgi:hypothetical protein